MARAPSNQNLPGKPIKEWTEEKLAANPHINPDSGEATPETPPFTLDSKSLEHLTELRDKYDRGHKALDRYLNSKQAQEEITTADFNRVASKRDKYAHYVGALGHVIQAAGSSSDPVTITIDGTKKTYS